MLVGYLAACDFFATSIMRRLLPCGARQLVAPSGCVAAARWGATAATDGGAGAAGANQQQQQQQGAKASASSDGASAGPEAEWTSDTKSKGIIPEPEPMRKYSSIEVISTSGKGVYWAPYSSLAANDWRLLDFKWWWWFALTSFIGSQMVVRYRVSNMATAQQAKLGETLLDQSARDLLSDIETLRQRDPLRLENEANTYHKAFWSVRAKAVAEQRKHTRNVEMDRGHLIGAARGQDMEEWKEAAQKDHDEVETVKRTHEYIRGFHQHLKAKRLI